MKHCCTFIPEVKTENISTFTVLI